ncbi:MAG: PQQ-dependent sugar dehydrogenase [Planctomycetota bacterium]|jgi:putative heme-binding domain-containing protein
MRDGFTAVVSVLLLGGVSACDTAAQGHIAETYVATAMSQPGSAARGKPLFDTHCLVCHRVGETGQNVGPDLTHIGFKFDRPHLIESVIDPSRQIVEGFRTDAIETADGRSLIGFVRSESDRALTVFDVAGAEHTIALSSVKSRTPLPRSLMPETLAMTMSPEQFTDLIAYLETLRPDKNLKPGGKVIGPITVPLGFNAEIIATGLSGATALESLPDGRILVCEQVGHVRVIENGVLLDEPLVTLPVDSSWERGVIGVTVHPRFPEEPYVYVCWVAKAPFPHHRISRFRVEGNRVVAGSERVLLFGDDQTKMGGKVKNGHQGGALHFGPDGKLYIGIGEQTAGTPSQDLDTFLGKILRINGDGSIPEDNPFFDQTTGKYRAIWALGGRNPFTFAFRRTDGLMLINDVGGEYEEVNVGRAGANYGWPAVDHGPLDSHARFVGPIHWYPQASINGGDFIEADSMWPEPWRGRYFFADFVHGWVRALDPNEPTQAIDFVTGVRRPVDLRFAPDGTLYVLLRNAWVIDDKFNLGTGSLLKITYRGDAKGRQTSGARSVRLDDNAHDESAGGLPSYRIDTPGATYYLEKSGAGLSSLIDREGHDWISFHPEPGSGAGGEYRGFPNAVHKQGGSYFHPRNRGTDQAVIRVLSVDDNRVSIAATSLSGHWSARYDFYATHCDFTVTRLPEGKRYWVLYEGTPGGQYDDNDWWITSSEPEPHPLTNRHEGDIDANVEGVEWIAFGDKSLDRTLVLAQHGDDRSPDTFYQMKKQMTVFGFGRKGLEKHLHETGRRYSIGFVEGKTPDLIDRHVQARRSGEH